MVPCPSFCPQSNFGPICVKKLFQEKFLSSKSLKHCVKCAQQHEFITAAWLRLAQNPDLNCQICRSTVFTGNPVFEHFSQIGCLHSMRNVNIDNKNIISAFFTAEIDKHIWVLASRNIHERLDLRYITANELNQFMGFPFPESMNLLFS